ncbi:MAG: hypothetical protein WBY53_18710 [Acidobacteriaceae bacterium]
MRNSRALLFVIAVLIIVVAALCYALLNRHTTTTVVVSAGGLIGGSANAGDTLVFETYLSGDPGYKVNFTTNSPCTNGEKSLTVTPEQPATCVLAAPKGGQVSYIYQIERNLSQSVQRPDTVVPCRLCYLNNGSTVGSSADHPTITATSPSDNANVEIGCSVGADGQPGVNPEEADVTNDKVATVGWLQIDSAWVVKTGDPNACTATSYSSDGSNGPSQCNISPQAPANTYTYTWHLTCNGKATSGLGQVKVYANSAAQ